MNSIEKLTKVVQDILDVIYFDNNGIIKTWQYRSLIQDLRRVTGTSLCELYCHYCRATIKWDGIPDICPMCGAHICEREVI